MPVAPTFALGPPPAKDDPSYDNWVNLMWKWIRYLSANAGSGTVTSVAQTVPSIMSVSGSPITTSGTLAITLATEAANKVFSGPTTGADAAPTFRSLVAADLPAGTGTVTSVAQTVPAEFSVAGSPITTSGTLEISKATQSANTVWAGPTSGSAAQPSFRALVAADIPSNIGSYYYAAVHG